MNTDHSPTSEPASGTTSDTVSDVVSTVEAALAAGDGQPAMRLIEANMASLPHAKTLYMRAWNLIAWGVDQAEMFDIDQMRNHSRDAAQKSVDFLRARHQFQRDLSDPVRALYDTETGLALHKRDYPWVCFQLVTHGCLTREGTHALIRWAWTSAEFPEDALGAQAWALIFGMADGTVTDAGSRMADSDAASGRGAAAADEPGPRWPPGHKLWRGAIRERATGMAWTGDRDRAEWFARRFESLGASAAQVWELSTTELPTSRLLGRFTQRDEDEYVLDTSGLVVGTDIRAV